MSNLGQKWKLRNEYHEYVFSVNRTFVQNLCHLSEGLSEKEKDELQITQRFA